MTNTQDAAVKTDIFDQLAHNERAKTTPPKSKDIVRVVCRLPHGLNIRLYKPGKTVDGETVYLPYSDFVKLNGANTSKIVGGCGFTDVDREFWEEWVKQNKDFRPLKLRLLWAESTRERALSSADEMSGEKTGFEGINPDKPGKGLKRYDPHDMDADA